MSGVLIRKKQGILVSNGVREGILIGSVNLPA